MNKIPAFLVLGASLIANGAAFAGSDWPTYGFDSLRTNNNPTETILGPSTVGGLVQKWAFDAGQFDKALDPNVNPTQSTLRGQAVVGSGVSVAGVKTDLAYLGDNNGSFFALDLNSPSATGRVVWYRSLGAIKITVPKPQSSGVSGAAAIDRAANGGKGAVYVGTNGRAQGFDMATGADLPGFPIPVVADPASQTDGRIHTGANLVNGQLYLTTAANGSDTPPYWGRVLRVDTAKASLSGTWYTMSGNATQPADYGGGIWGWGGVAIDPTAAVGGVYVATGNSFIKTGQTPKYAERVVNLSPDLTQILGQASPILPAGDNDYGSTPTVFHAANCNNKMLTVKNKTGQLVLMTIGPAGGLAVIQIIQAGAPPTDPVAPYKYRGTTAWDAASQLLLVTSVGDGPDPYTHGLTAFKFNPACASPFLSFAWHATQQRDGTPITPAGTLLSSPAIANGVAYFGAGNPDSYVYAVALAAGPGITAGQLLWQSPLLTNCTANTTPTIINGKLIVPCAGIAPKVFTFGLP